MNNNLNKYLDYINSISKEELVEELIEAGIDDYLIDKEIYMNLINKWLSWIMLLKLSKPNVDLNYTYMLLYWRMMEKVFKNAVI